MLQVPCLSPPIYGHSHYKKFWLRQTELGGVSCEMKSTSSPDASSNKRICGKRRPQLRSSLASSKTDVERLKVPLNESPGAVSSTSSGEFPSGWKRSFRKFQRGSDGDATNSMLSSVENRDGAETPIRSGSPVDDKCFISMSEEKSSLQFLQLNECQASLLATQEEKEECKQLVRQNRSSTDSDDEPNVSHSSEQTAAASLDCLTSKCKGIDSREEEDGSEQDSDNENTSSESDSAISSTSQASEHDDARSHSDKSSFREHLKRQSKREAIKAIDAKPASYGSPKTRQMAAALENPVSPSGRSTQVMGSSSANNAHNVSRTCKHCGTMKTPLWRNGPLGPKSLCNACGIRLRKARRSSSNHEGQTANLSGKRKLVQAEATLMSDLSSRHPYKKSRLTFAREKREHVEIEGILGSRSSLPERLTMLGYDPKPPSMLGKSLSKDEEEGAVLLMALSCGLVLA